MNLPVRLLAFASACAMLNGCVAAVVPIVAAGAVGGKQVLGGKRDRADTPATPVAAAAPATLRTVAAPAAVVATAPSVEPAPSAPVAPPPALPTHQWRDMVTHVADLLQARTRPVDSVVPAPGARSGFVPCGAKPFAVIVDVDGTLLPQAGATGTTLRTDEAARAFGDLRFGHATVIFTSGRPADETGRTENALERAALGPAMQGRELLLVADGPAGSSKAALRAAAAMQYCVLAVVGDEPEDFGDLPTAGGGPAMLASRWGTGWFRVPGRAVPK